MGCGCSTPIPRQAIKSSEEEKVTPETFGNTSNEVVAAPERVAMDEVELIAGEYTKVENDYTRASTPEAPEQAGIGTWGTGDRFLTNENGVPGAKYNLPEVTGTDTCNAVFGKMTGERFPVSDNGVPGPKYDLPVEHDACNAVFGKMTGDRFVDLDNLVPGPGAYNSPKRFPDEPWKEPCFAVFGKDTADRMVVDHDATEVAFGNYDVEKSFNGAAVKMPTSAFGKKTGKRFTPVKSFGRFLQR